MYTDVKYEGLYSYQSKDMADVKVFVDKETNKWTGQELHALDLSMPGHNKPYRATSGPYGFYLFLPIYPKWFFFVFILSLF